MTLIYSFLIPYSLKALKIYIKLFVKIESYGSDHNKIFVNFERRLTNQKQTFLRNFLSSLKFRKKLASHCRSI